MHCIAYSSQYQLTTDGTKPVNIPWGNGWIHPGSLTKGKHGYCWANTSKCPPMRIYGDDIYAFNCISTYKGVCSLPDCGRYKMDSCCAVCERHVPSYSSHVLPSQQITTVAVGRKARWTDILVFRLLVSVHPSQHNKIAWLPPQLQSTDRFQLGWKGKPKNVSEIKSMC